MRKISRKNFVRGFAHASRTRKRPRLVEDAAGTTTRLLDQSALMRLFNRDSLRAAVFL
jgi:hypothetical protein